MSSRIVTLHYNPEKYQNYLEMSSATSSRIYVGQSPSQETLTRPSSHHSSCAMEVTCSEEPESGDDSGVSLTLKRSHSRSSVTSWVTDSEEIAATNNSSRNAIRGNMVGINSVNGVGGASRIHLISRSSGFNSGLSSGSPSFANDIFFKKEPANGTIAETTSTPSKNTQESLRDMSEFKNRFLAKEPIGALEEEWWSDVRNVSDRLHFLKESYKAIQSLKQKRLHRKSDPKDQSLSQLDPSIHQGSFSISGSDDEQLGSSQNIQHISIHDDPYSSSNSNTTTPAPSETIYLQK